MTKLTKLLLLTMALGACPVRGAEAKAVPAPATVEAPDAIVSTPVQTYVLTVGELRAALENLRDDQPVAVAVGDYKAAAVRLDFRLMTPDDRAGWWDNHQDVLRAEWVLVLRESVRAEARVP